jgi:cation/acetate symporter
MTILHPARHHHRRIGTYLGIFASGFLSLFLGALIAEQMGVGAGPLNILVLVVTLAAFAGIGLAGGADDGREYFAAGRAVPSHYSGLALALTAVGGTGIICITGTFVKIGIDALVLMNGWITGLVLAGVLIFPFLRKCGAYTVPSYLGLRLDSRIVRMVAALVMIVPTLMILAAEIRIGAFVATWMTGLPEASMVVVVALAATAAVIIGGMRGLTWSSVAQAIAVLIAVVTPAVIVSLLISNLPFPQLMHGSLLQGFRRIELAQVTKPFTALISGFQMPGPGLEALTGPYLQSFGNVGRLSLPFVILVIATGLASLPAVLQRAGTSTTVYESRKSVGWAVLTAAFMLLTLVSIAGFFRGYIAEQIVNAAGDRLPVWFQTLQQLGFASVAKTRAAIALDSIQLKRDVAFLALPMAAGLPLVLGALAAAGAMLAAATAAAAQITALAGMISEDLMHGGRREAPDDKIRLVSARLACALAGGAGLLGALMVSDPLAIVLAALALSAATAFPVIVMSILWRKVSRLGAVAGMMTGFGVTVVLMFGAITGMIGLPPVLAAAIGGPANFLVLVLISQAAPLTSRRAMEVVRDLRSPGGEATYDREMRLLRRKRATAPA